MSKLLEFLFGIGPTVHPVTGEARRPPPGPPFTLPAARHYPEMPMRAPAPDSCRGSQETVTHGVGDDGYLIHSECDQCRASMRRPRDTSRDMVMANA